MRGAVGKVGGAVKKVGGATVRKVVGGAVQKVRDHRANANANANASAAKDGKSGGGMPYGDEEGAGRGGIAETVPSEGRGSGERGALGVGVGGVRGGSRSAAAAAASGGGGGDATGGAAHVCAPTREKRYTGHLLLATGER